MKQRLSEHAIQSQILDWLTLKGIFHYRQNSGGMKKGKHFVKFGAKGAPDVVCVIRSPLSNIGQYVGIEVKTRGGLQSADQFEFALAINRAGGRYILAYSLDDVKQALGSS